MVIGFADHPVKDVLFHDCILWSSNYLKSSEEISDSALIDVVGQVGYVSDVWRTARYGLVVDGHAAARRPRRRRQHHRRPVPRSIPVVLTLHKDTLYTSILLFITYIKL